MPATLDLEKFANSIGLKDAPSKGRSGGPVGLEDFANEIGLQNAEPAAVAPKAKDKPFFNLKDAGSSLWDALRSFGYTVPAAYHQAIDGLERPDKYSIDSQVAREKADNFTQEMREKSGGSSVGDAFREAASSTGFSVGSMASGLPLAVAGGEAGALAGPIGATAGFAGGMAAGSFGAAYRMAGSQFLEDTFQNLEEASQRERGRPMDESEKEAAYKALLPVAQDHALWEAGPEAIGNAALMGLGKVALNIGKPVLAGLANSAMGKIATRVAAGAAGAGTELATETATAIGQGETEAKAKAYAEGKPMEDAVSRFSGEGGVGKAFEEVAPSTLALTALLGGGAKAIDWTAKGIASRFAKDTEASQSTEGPKIEMVNGKPIDISGLTPVDQDSGPAKASAQAILDPNNPTIPREVLAMTPEQREQYLADLALRQSPQSAQDLRGQLEREEIIRSGNAETAQSGINDFGAQEGDLLQDFGPLQRGEVNSAPESAAVIDAALAEEERIKQSPVGAQGLTEDLAQREAESRMLMEQGIPGLEGMYSRTPEGWMHNAPSPIPTSEQMNLFLEEEFLRRNPGQKTILSESITGVPQQAPEKAISSPSEASLPPSAVPTLGATENAPEATETPKTPLPAEVAQAAVTEAENDIAKAQKQGVGPNIIQHLRNRLTAAQKAQMEVTLANGSKTVAPAVIKIDGQPEVNEAPAAFIAAEKAVAENARLSAEKAKAEAEKEKEKAKAEKEKAKVQSTEEKAKAAQPAATNIETKEEPDHDHAVKQLKGKKVSLTKLEDGEEVTKSGLDAQDEYQKNLKREKWLTQLLACLKS